MLRRLFRLLIIGLILAVVAYVASRVMGGDDDDFDDFDDLDSGFEFQETPVEIDVPATASTQPASDVSSSSVSTTTRLDDTVEMASDNSGRLIDINGIGPAYEARLQAIGIHSIGDLVNADSESIASQIEVIGGTATIDDWISQARAAGANGQS
ncbi:MAG: helix-hairpin-helix domain-containing protein [Chloroflexota bacterium]